jgi:hypothetical protein
MLRLEERQEPRRRFTTQVARPLFEDNHAAPTLRRVMTERNRKQHRPGDPIASNEFILWIEPGGDRDIQTMASPLRSGEILAVGQLDRIFRGLIDALLQSDSRDRP